MSRTPLLALVRPFVEADPARAAQYLESMSEADALVVLRALPTHLAAAVFPHLQVSYAAALLGEADAKTVAAVANRLDPKRAATILMHLTPELREQFLPHVSEKLKAEIQEHLTYPEGSVGRMMSTQFLAFRDTMTAKAAIRRIRAMAKKGMPQSYVYIVDENSRLLGVLNMFDLMLADPDVTLDQIMRKEVFALPAFTDREDAAEELSKRKYFAAPVVDAESRIVGLIKVEQLLSGMQEDVTEDLLLMFGAGGDERAFSPLKFSLSKRLPWLHVNLLTAFMAAAVVAIFEPLIAQVTVLAVFLPVVAGQGGNAGAQSLAIVMRGLVMREIPREKRTKLVAKETALGLVNGVVTGIVTGLVAWMWYGNFTLGVVVTLGMAVNLLFAGMAGASIPLLLKALRLDPAQCSSIILTTVTDVVGFFAFLGFALVFKAKLIPPADQSAEVAAEFVRSLMNCVT